MTDVEQFPILFERLKTFLIPVAENARVSADLPGVFMLETQFSEKFGREISIGGVKIQKNYVSFYLMPVYIYPDLLGGISEGLKKRMQGKSCFNFTQLDENLLYELSQLTEKGLQRYRDEGLLK